MGDLLGFVSAGGSDDVGLWKWVFEWRELAQFPSEALPAH